MEFFPPHQATMNNTSSSGSRGNSSSMSMFHHSHSHSHSGGYDTESSLIHTKPYAVSDNDICSNDNMNYNDHDNDEDHTDSDSNDSQLQDAVATASALVGENVLDSPQGSRPIAAVASCYPVSSSTSTSTGASSSSSFSPNRSTKTRPRSGSWSGGSASFKYPSPPSSLNSHMIRGGVGVGNSTNDTNACTSSNATSSSSTTDANALSVGIMAQGLAWVQRHRDRRRRHYLQNQAEQQLLRIRKAAAEKAQAAAATTTTTSTATTTTTTSSLADNPTFQNFAKVLNLDATMPSSSSSSDPGSGSKTSNSNHTNNKKKEYSLSSTLSSCSPYEPATAIFSTITASASSPNLFSSYYRPAVSQSGDGYSVSLSAAILAAAVSESSTSSDENGGGGGTGTHPHSQEQEADPSWVPPVRVEPEGGTSCLEPIPYILSQHEMQQIAELVLPRGIAYCRWKRLYSLARDGDSFDQCMRCVENEPRTLLVLRTSRNQVCGGFADMAWSHTTSVMGSGCYFGGPTACLFKLITIPTTATTTTEAQNNNNDDNNNNNSKLIVYPWTGANRYIQLCDPPHKMLAFGGGGDDGAFGLSVEQDFQVGSTGHCDTFDNEPLCDQETFRIVDMEIFGFLTGQF